MPVYLPPNFNSLCNAWAPPTTPAANLPTFVGFPLQIYVYGRVPNLLFHPGSGRYLPLIILREPFAAGAHLGVDWIVEHPGPPGVPQGRYRVQYAQHMHAGFPNQYFAYYALQCNANGSIPHTPLPS